LRRKHGGILAAHQALPFTPLHNRCRTHRPITDKISAGPR
jgi:hypothetical protein